jgi:predicted DsbA family dithiol-disulfide isomerase
MEEIEVFADIGCPFTHVGLRRLVERRGEVGADDRLLRVRAWPLELVNGEPLDADFIAHEVDELRAQVAPDLFTGFDRSRFPATFLPAFALAAHAYRSRPQVGERVSLALRDALFEDGRDIGDRAVLTEIARRHDLRDADLDDRMTVTADWHEGRARGVLGSPHFFVGGRGFFCPSLEIEKADDHLRVRRDDAAIEAFFAECFA